MIDEIPPSFDGAPHPQGFVETRRKLLGLKSNLQQNWTAYAVANHVAGNTETTVQAIDAFIKTLKVQHVPKTILKTFGVFLSPRCGRGGGLGMLSDCPRFQLVS